MELDLELDHVKLEFCPSLYGHHVTILRWLQQQDHVTKLESFQIGFLNMTMS